MEKITILQFTDPICVWCWGNEPVLRAIDYLYGEKVNIRYIMGGLVEDITTLYDIQGSKEEIIKQSNKKLEKNWLAAAEKHGMPVVTTNMEFFTERYPSSFPQNIAYEAAKRIDSKQAKLFLRLLREATFIESRRTSQIDVLLDIATQAGYNAAEFIDEYTTGSANADFMQDRMLCRRNGITGFPSYLIRHDDTEVILGGYQNLNTFNTIIKRLSSGKIKPRKVGPSIANLLDFAHRYNSIYSVEVECVFGLDRYQTDLIIGQLISAGKFKAENIGNSLRLTINDTSRTKHHQNRGKTQNNKSSQHPYKKEPIEA